MATDAVKLPSASPRLVRAVAWGLVALCGFLIVSILAMASVEGPANTIRHQVYRESTLKLTEALPLGARQIARHYFTCMSTPGVVHVGKIAWVMNQDLVEDRCRLQVLDEAAAQGLAPLPVWGSIYAIKATALTDADMAYHSTLCSSKQPLWYQHLVDRPWC